MFHRNMRFTRNILCFISSDCGFSVFQQIFSSDVPDSWNRLISCHISRKECQIISVVQFSIRIFPFMCIQFRVMSLLHVDPAGAFTQSEIMLPSGSGFPVFCPLHHAVVHIKKLCSFIFSIFDAMQLSFSFSDSRWPLLKTTSSVLMFLSSIHSGSFSVISNFHFPQPDMSVTSVSPL